MSGGVDSMALATLCSKNLSGASTLKAFVIDHGARDGSSDEADYVAMLLRRDLGNIPHFRNSRRHNLIGFQELRPRS